MHFLGQEIWYTYMFIIANRTMNPQKSIRLRQRIIKKTDNSILIVESSSFQDIMHQTRQNKQQFAKKTKVSNRNMSTKYFNYQMFKSESSDNPLTVQIAQHFLM